VVQYFVPQALYCAYTVLPDGCWLSHVDSHVVVVQGCRHAEYAVQSLLCLHATRSGQQFWNRQASQVEVELVTGHAPASDPASAPPPACGQGPGVAVTLLNRLLLQQPSVQFELSCVNVVQSSAESTSTQVDWCDDPGEPFPQERSESSV
jgi:hypothetical protein